jgi:hypothetical protein
VVSLMPIHFSHILFHVVHPPSLGSSPNVLYYEALSLLFSRFGDVGLCCCNASKLIGIEIKKTLEVILVYCANVWMFHVPLMC